MFWMVIIIALAIWGAVAASRTRKPPTEDPKVNSNRTPTVPHPIRTSTLNATFIAQNREATTSIDTFEVVKQFVGAVNHVNRFVESLDSKVTLLSEVQMATSQLSIEIASERTVFDAALEASKREIESAQFREKLPPSSQGGYDSKIREVGKLLEGLQTNKVQARPSYSKPNFNFPLRHSDETTANAIVAKISQLELERKKYVKEIRKRVFGTELEAHFIPALKRLAGPEALKALTDSVTASAGQAGYQRAEQRAESLNKDRPWNHPFKRTIGARQSMHQFSIMRHPTAVQIPYLTHFTRS